MTTRAATALALVAVALGACGGGAPRAVVLHEDQCAYCRMEVADARFAAEVVTRTGRVHLFDSVECLVGYVRAAESGELNTIWVTDFERPGSFVAASEAGYLVESDLRGPMGSAVAFASIEAAQAAQAGRGGRIVGWATLLADSSHRAAPVGP